MAKIITYISEPLHTYLQLHKTLFLNYLLLQNRHLQL